MPCTTILTETEVNHFFNVEIDIPEANILREEGANRLEDLVEFNTDDINTIAEALSKPEGYVLSGSGARTAPALSSAPDVHIGTKELMLLEVSMQIIKFYEMLNLKITASVLRYALIIKNFTLEFDLIKENEKKEVSTPHVSQKIDSMRWTEAFMCLLSMIVRAKTNTFIMQCAFRRQCMLCCSF